MVILKISVRLLMQFWSIYTDKPCTLVLDETQGRIFYFFILLLKTYADTIWHFLTLILRWEKADELSCTEKQKMSFSMACCYNFSFSFLPAGISWSKDSFLQQTSFETLLGKTVLLGFVLSSTTWRHSSNLNCGMGLETVQENRVGYGRLHICKKEVEILTLFVWAKSGTEDN